ncbi:MAG: glucose-1-phosphate adenylyltransferase [Burkholderiales bacterium]|nr:glucose-1-phosphate adenylyltransferase [Burkholderiales bacterium]
MKDKTTPENGRERGEADALRASSLLQSRRVPLARRTVAMVLAGGRGERLAQLTDWRCKPAVPFGGKFRIIDFTLSNCVNSGIRRIGVLTQYKAQSLIRHLQRGWSLLDGRLDEFVEVMPAQQQLGANWYRGTADAVFQNIDALLRSRPEYVLVLAGDHVYKMDYGRMLGEHVASDADLTVGCVEVPIAQASAFGVMAVDERGQVAAFQEKPADPKCIPGRPEHALASMGIYVFRAPFLYEQLELDAAQAGSTRDFGRDIVPSALRQGRRVHACRLDDSSVASEAGKPYWRDVGTVDAYWAANLDLVSVTPELNLYDRDWPIWTYQEQLPSAKFVFDSDKRRGVALDSMVSGGCIVSGATVRRSVLFSNVQVCDSLIEDSVLLPGVRTGRDVVVRRAVIDARCQLPDGLRVGVDPHEDRTRFHVTAAGVTLVTPEMLGQNIHHQP